MLIAGQQQAIGMMMVLIIWQSFCALGAQARVAALKFAAEDKEWGKINGGEGERNPAVIIQAGWAFACRALGPGAHSHCWPSADWHTWAQVRAGHAPQHQTETSAERWNIGSVAFGCASEHCERISQRPFLARVKAASYRTPTPIH